MELSDEQRVEIVKELTRESRDKYAKMSDDERNEVSATIRSEIASALGNQLADLYNQDFHLQTYFGLLNHPDSGYTGVFDKEELVKLMILTLKTDAKRILDRFEQATQISKEVGDGVSAEDAPIASYAVSEAKRFYQRALQLNNRYDKVKKKIDKENE